MVAELMAVWVFVPLLAGMRIVYAADILKGMEKPFYKIWSRGSLYLVSIVCVIINFVVWLCSGRSAYMLRLWDMIASYLLLAIVDWKKKIVPDTVLVCFFAAQMLLGAVTMDPERLFSVLFTGGMLFLFLIAFAWLSKGRLGMGDAELLGVTAMAAGWAYVVQIVTIALIFSFFYGLWLLFFRRMTMKTEIPFVPFLAAAMAVHTVYIVL